MKEIMELPIHTAVAPETFNVKDHSAVVFNKFNQVLGRDM